MVRGRHFRGAAGHRRDPGLLYGGDVHCSHVFRMEQGEPRFPPGLHVADRIGCHHLRLVDSGSQCLDAISRGHDFQSGHGTQRDDGFPGRGAVAHGCQQVLPYRIVRLGAGCPLRGWRQLLVPVEAARQAVCPLQRQSGGVGRPGGSRALCLDGRRFGLPGGAEATNEAGCHGRLLRRTGGSRPRGLRHPESAEADTR